MLIILSIGFLCRIGLGKFFGRVEFLFFCFLLIFFYCWSLEMFLRREIFLIFFIVIILGLECCICGIGVELIEIFFFFGIIRILVFF